MKRNYKQQVMSALPSWKRALLYCKQWDWTLKTSLSILMQQCDESLLLLSGYWRVKPAHLQPNWPQWLLFSVLDGMSNLNIANSFKILSFSCIILQRVCTITDHNLSTNTISYQAMSSRHRSLYNVRSLWRRGVGMKTIPSNLWGATSSSQSSSLFSSLSVCLVLWWRFIFQRDYWHKCSTESIES